VLRRNNVQRLSFTDSRIANKLGDAKLGEGNVWQSMMTATFDKDTNKWSASYGDLFLAE
jgi:transketolase N-terminal domain/subunit